MRSGLGFDRSGGEAGFTLIEALVALAIASAGVAVFTQFASTAFHNWHRGRDGAAVLDMITTGLGQLDRDVGRTLPVPVRRARGAPVLFRGEIGRVVFVAATGLKPGDGGLEIVSVRAVPNGAGRSLVRERGPLSGGVDGPLSDPVVLIQGALDFRFAFVDEMGRRSTSWIDQPRLPARIELDLTHRDGRPVLGATQAFVVPANYGVECLDTDLERTGAKARCGIRSDGDGQADKTSEADQAPAEGGAQR